MTPDAVAADLSTEFQKQLEMTNEVPCLKVRYEDFCTDPRVYDELKKFTMCTIPDIGGVGSFNALNPARQDEFERQVRAQLDAVSESIRNDGYRLVQEIHMGRLDDDGEEAVTFDLGRGQTYMLMGVCDTDCSDLDLVLYDGDGDEVDSDLELDDVPIVEVSVDRADSYRLEVTMAACDAEPCRFGIGVYGRAGGSTSSSLTNSFMSTVCVDSIFTRSKSFSVRTTN